MIKYECIKDITRELKKHFKGIQANSYGYCCNSDYDAYHKYINENDYICANIFKGGLNNDYIYNSYEGKSFFKLGNDVYFKWRLTNFNLEDVIKVIQDVASKYNYLIEKPKDKFECIRLYEQ